MIFAELPLEACHGAMLAHAIILGGRRWPKGSPVDPALLAAARAAGTDRLWVARPDAGDVTEEEAATRLAEALAAAGVSAQAPVHGRVNLHAATAGLLTIDSDSLSQLNQASEELAVATLPPLTPVRPGDLVATVKIIPYAVPGTMLAAAIASAAGAIGVAPWRPGLKAVLLQSRTAETPAKLLAKTAAVTRDRLSALGLVLTEVAPVPHAVDALAAALLAAPPADLLLVAGATATSDRRDVVPAAILAAGGQVERVGMPVDPGNLLVLGRLGEVPVIGLPGCARSPKRNGLDLLLERFAAGLAIDTRMIAGMGVGGLLEESGQPVPWGWAG